MTAFATIFVAELPDKTMLATIVLSARFRRPFSVWTGAAAALTAQMVIATTAGRLLSLLPDRPCPLRGRRAVRHRRRSSCGDRATSDPDEHDGIAGDLPDRDNPTARRVERLPTRRIVATVFGIVFLAEWGDLTQLATASLAAKGHAVSVFVGASLAMITVAAIGVVAGRTLLRVIPAGVLHRDCRGRVRRPRRGVLPRRRDRRREIDVTAGRWSWCAWSCRCCGMRSLASTP